MFWDRSEMVRNSLKFCSPRVSSEAYYVLLFAASDCRLQTGFPAASDNCSAPLEQRILVPLLEAHQLFLNHLHLFCEFKKRFQNLPLGRRVPEPGYQRVNTRHRACQLHRLSPDLGYCTRWFHAQILPKLNVKRK